MEDFLYLHFAIRKMGIVQPPQPQMDDNVGSLCTGFKLSMRIPSSCSEGRCHREPESGAGSEVSTGRVEPDA